MKRNNIALITVFILILQLTACKWSQANSIKNSTINFDDVQRILYSVGQREVEIIGDADKKNIIFLLKSLSTPVGQTSFNFNSKLILYIHDNKFDVNMSEIYLKINNNIYKNQSVSRQISSICENYLYSISNYVTLLNPKTNIKLRSKDIDRSILLTSDMKNELINLLKKTSRHQSQDEIFFLAPDYPYYQIISDDNSIPPITIYKNSIITVETTELEVYFINSPLYEFCMKYLPLTDFKLTGLKELYLSDTLKLKETDGDNAYKSKMLPIIRVLNESVLSNDKPDASSDMIELLFYQNKALTKVIVCKDGLIYRNNYYKYKDLKTFVVNTLNAN